MSSWAVQPVDVSRIMPLREAVLSTPDRRDLAFPGDAASATVHLAAVTAGGEAVGCVTLMRAPLENKDATQLRGMAVDPAYQSQGVGGALLRACHERVGAQRLWCNARVAAIGFYEKHGWACVSPIFEVPGVGPHRVMRRLVDGGAG